jgi:hypothetical protein
LATKKNGRSRPRIRLNKAEIDDALARLHEQADGNGYCKRSANALLVELKGITRDRAQRIVDALKDRGELTTSRYTYTLTAPANTSATDVGDEQVSAIAKVGALPDQVLAYDNGLSLEENLLAAIRLLAAVEQHEMPSYYRGPKGAALLLMHVMGSDTEDALEIPLMVKLLILIEALRFNADGTFECQQLSLREVETLLRNRGIKALANVLDGLSAVYIHDLRVSDMQGKADVLALRDQLHGERNLRKGQDETIAGLRRKTVLLEELRQIAETEAQRLQARLQD